VSTIVFSTTGSARRSLDGARGLLCPPGGGTILAPRCTRSSTCTSSFSPPSGSGTWWRLLSKIGEQAEVELAANCVRSTMRGVAVAGPWVNFGSVRPKIAVAAGCLLLAAPGAANAGNITPIQYAYGGGSNAAAVIASQPPALAANAGQPPAPAATSPSTQTGGSAASGSGGAVPNGHKPATRTPQPLVGIAAAPAAAVGSFDALHRAIPTDALWAVALAVACALGAWFVRRGSA
jgi:hypothetical protein